MKCPVRDILRICVILPSHTVIQSEAKNLGNTKKGKHQEDEKWMLPRFFTTLRSVLNDTQGKEEHTGKETQKKKNTRREQKKEILLTI